MPAEVHERRGSEPNSTVVRKLLRHGDHSAMRDFDFSPPKRVARLLARIGLIMPLSVASTLESESSSAVLPWHRNQEQHQQALR